jgi:tetratricopeptide (TPR) repeat protein
MRTHELISRAVLTSIAICTLTAGMFPNTIALAQTPASAEEALSRHTKPIPSSLGQDEKYPYGSRQFTKFVDDSFENKGEGSADDFYNWMSNAYDSSQYRFKGHADLNFKELLREEKRRLSAVKSPAQKAHLELEICEQTHKLIKKMIPRFSLDRGFEFYYTVKNGERQCFLQSVLISSLLQDMGINAGVAMVWKNIHGENINNAHAVCIARLANNSDVIVDASEAEPFAKHQGLFLRTTDYRFLRPIYGATGNKIYFYRSINGHDRLRPYKVHTLDIPFLLSQFWYYRGERTPGALFSATRTRDGLDASARYLQTSIKASPMNPLAVYMLGRIYLLQGKEEQARSQFREAYKLYFKCGWVPDGPSQYFEWSKGVKAESTRLMSSKRRHS